MPNSNSASEFAPNANREANSPLDIYTQAERGGQRAAGIFTKEKEIISILEGGERLKRTKKVH